MSTPELALLCFYHLHVHGLAVPSVAMQNKSLELVGVLSLTRSHAVSHLVLHTGRLAQAGCHA